MKKIFKKSIACIAAAVMFVSAMPLTALASDKGMNIKTGIQISGYENSYGLLYYTSEAGDYALSVIKEANKDGVITVKKGNNVTITQSFGTYSSTTNSSAGNESIASNGLHWHYGDSTTYCLGTAVSNGSDAHDDWNAHLVGDRSKAIQSSVGGTIANKAPQDIFRATSSDGGSNEATGIYTLTPSSFPQLNETGEYSIELWSTISFEKRTYYLFQGNKWASIYGTQGPVVVKIRVVDDYKFVKKDGSSSTVTATSYSEALNRAPANTAQATVANNNGTHTIKTYSWPTSSSSTTINEVETPTTQSCYGGVATCTKKAVCDVCKAEYGELSDHVYKYTYKDKNVHIKSCENGDLTATDEAHTVNSTTGICTLCQEQVLDFSAYDTANGEVSDIAVTHRSEYTDESMSKYIELVNAAKTIRNNAATQADVDNATAQILAAKSVLRKVTSTVTVQTVADDSTEATTIATYTDQSYGTELTIDLTDKIGDDSVQKWIVTTDDGSTKTAVNTTDKKITLVVTKDVKVTVYTVKKPTDETKKYSKVVFLGKNGRVVDVKYVAEGDPLDTSTVSIPTIPFYSSNGWDKATVTGTGSDIYVRANYTSSLSDDWCVVHYIDNSGNDTTQKYSYDSYAKVPDDIEGDSFALAKDKDGTDILTYLDGRDFYVPYIKDIYVVPVSNKQAQIAITGSFSGLNNETNMKYATFNCKFYLPDGCKVVEWGAEISAGGRTQVVKGEKLSKGNEYSITMNINSATSITAFTGVAYVTYTDASGPHTLKSAPVEQSLN